jgi:hypothetical protein
MRMLLKKLVWKNRTLFSRDGGGHVLRKKRGKVFFLGIKKGGKVEIIMMMEFVEKRKGKKRKMFWLLVLCVMIGMTEV